MSPGQLHFSTNRNHSDGKFSPAFPRLCTPLCNIKVIESEDCGMRAASTSYKQQVTGANSPSFNQDTRYRAWGLTGLGTNRSHVATPWLSHRLKLNDFVVPENTRKGMLCTKNTQTWSQIFSSLAVNKMSKLLAIVRETTYQYWNSWK